MQDRTEADPIPPIKPFFRHHADMVKRRMVYGGVIFGAGMLASLVLVHVTGQVPVEVTINYRELPKPAVFTPPVKVPDRYKTLTFDEAKARTDEMAKKLEAKTQASLEEADAD